MDLYEFFVKCSGGCHSVHIGTGTLETGEHLINMLEAMWDTDLVSKLSPKLQECLGIWEGCDIQAQPHDSTKPTLFYSDKWEEL